MQKKCVLFLEVGLWNGELDHYLFNSRIAKVFIHDLLKLPVAKDIIFIIPKENYGAEGCHSHALVGNKTVVVYYASVRNANRSLSIIWIFIGKYINYNTNIDRPACLFSYFWMTGGNEIGPSLRLVG